MDVLECLAKANIPVKVFDLPKNQCLFQPEVKAEWDSFERQVMEYLKQEIMTDNQQIIVLCGVTGCGKTTVFNLLVDEMKGAAVEERTTVAGAKIIGKKYKVWIEDYRMYPYAVKGCNHLYKDTIKQLKNFFEFGGKVYISATTDAFVVPGIADDIAKYNLPPVKVVFFRTKERAIFL